MSRSLDDDTMHTLACGSLFGALALDVEGGEGMSEVEDDSGMLVGVVGWAGVGLATTVPSDSDTLNFAAEFAARTDTGEEVAASACNSATKGSSEGAATALGTGARACAAGNNTRGSVVHVCAAAASCARRKAPPESGERAHV